MRIVCISDTHGHHKELVIPECDVLIHAGDLTQIGEYKLLREVDEFFNKLPLPKERILTIAGNHDLSLEQERIYAETFLSSCTYLRDSHVVIDGVKFYGSPWTPKFFNWAFMLDVDKHLQAAWSLIPQDTDVLITHGPPFGILDKNTRGEKVGCKFLLNKVLQVKPNLHVFGHIHEAYGTKLKSNIKFINASVCNVRNKIHNSPVIIDI